MTLFKSLFDYLSQGGLLMIPILLSSVIALGIFLERFWFLRRINIIPDKVVSDLLALLKEKKLSEAETLAKHHNNYLIARLFLEVINSWSYKKDRIKERLDESGKQEVALMERYIGGISVVATIAPLMGLLGTVSGMISVFQQFVYSQQDPSFMSEGISKALITTAAGMVVAIPSILMHRYLLSRAERIRLEIEKAIFEAIELHE
ncbi:MotA/TolQ/ExbB proton channel family protein [bacterium]|nr:MotA/TolQ/ExbB proton channel family protein [bacterium]